MKKVKLKIVKNEIEWKWKKKWKGGKRGKDQERIDNKSKKKYDITELMSVVQKSDFSVRYHGNG